MFLGGLKEKKAREFDVESMNTSKQVALYLIFLLANIASNINQYVCVYVYAISNWFFASIVFPKTKNYISILKTYSARKRRRRKMPDDEQRRIT